MTRVCALVVALLSASGTANAAGGGTVAGSVAGVAAPESLSTVDVRLVNVFTGSVVATTRLDNKGNFAFQSVTDGQYGVEAINKTACDISRTFSVSQDSMTVVQLRLKDKTLCSGPVSFAN